MHPSILIILLSCMLQNILVQATQPDQIPSESAYVTNGEYYSPDIPSEVLQMAEKHDNIDEGEKLIQSICDSLPSVEGWTRVWHSVFIKVQSINYTETFKYLLNGTDDEDMDD